MSDKKLSEEIRDIEPTLDRRTLALNWRDRARALEERVAGLEAELVGTNAAFDALGDVYRRTCANRDAATARAEAAEKECAELREIAAQRCTQAEAAERKLEMHIAAHDMTSDQLEVAEAERKEFMLETQRKEIECNELASEVARLRDDLAEALAANDSIPVRDNLIESLASQRDALQAKLDGTDGKWKLAAAQATALRAKLAKVRAVAEGGT